MPNNTILLIVHMLMGLGALILFSRIKMSKSKETPKINGKLVITEFEDKILYSIELNHEIEEIDNMKSVFLLVENRIAQKTSTIVKGE